MTIAARIDVTLTFVTVLAGASACGTAIPARQAAPAPVGPPNVIVIFADDLGYGDIGPFGARDIPTPNLDRMAAEGAKLTSFYVSQAVCSASRASLLTGAYANRVSITGALGPRSDRGLHPDEVTIAETLKTRGYATALHGKWHLGDAPQFLPTRQGFDEYFGLPYSNDMWPPNTFNGAMYPPLPLYENDTVTAHDPDQAQLTTWYTDRAVRFIERHRASPFFLYVAHSMPHVPLFVSDKHRGRSTRGVHGDVIAELDWSVGRILDAVKTHGLAQNTLVVFTSDNGPWLVFGDHAGSAGPLREGKQTSFEGGVRVPALFWWPGKIPAGLVSDEVAGTIDLMPTVARLAGAALSSERRHEIDGQDIWPLLSTPGARSPHEAFFFYWGGGLEGVRRGRWKLHLPHPYTALAAPRTSGGARGTSRRATIARSLFDLDADPGETRDLSAQNPDVVRELEALVESMRQDLGDTLTARPARGARPAGQR